LWRRDVGWMVRIVEQKRWLDGEDYGRATLVGWRELWSDVGWIVRIVERRWFNGEDCGRVTLDGENFGGATLVGW